MPRVSVIVPVFNGIRYLPEFFESLAAALPEDSEVILVDDASTEAVYDTFPERLGGAPVVRLRNERNLGCAAAKNRGFQVATGDVLIHLNSDLVLDSRCLTAMVDVIARRDDVGIVGSKLVFPTTGLVQHVGMTFGNHTTHHVYFELPADHPLSNKSRDVQITTGATVAMSRRVLGRIGLLGESYFNHSDDTDHCLRAVREGYRNVVAAESVAYHWESVSGPTRFARIRQSEALFWATWGSHFAVDLDRFVDEALDHLVDAIPGIETTPFEILNLSRGADDAIVLDCLSRRWPSSRQRVRHYRQMNNASDRLWLPILLPHWIAREPAPFIYLVDHYRELEENARWFEMRRATVEHELVVDLTGVALLTSDVVPERGQ
ncbi:MAG TPA: glycosyltransferase [Actinomycetota bacterium]|nr:glycosyltransferase [Actinomycetota bacterium]